MAKTEFFPSQSAYVAQFYANQNFGSPPSLYFGQYLQHNDDYRTLLRFPLPFCPNRAIASATLEFNINRNEIPSGVVVNAALNQALQAWEQFHVTWNTQPLYSLIRTFPLTTSSQINSVISLDVTATVRTWLSGTANNYGFVITGNEAVNSLIGIHNVLAPHVVDHIPKDEEDRRFEHERELVGVLAHALSDCCGKRFHHKKRRDFDKRDQRDQDRPTIFVQHPYGSLHFVKASSLSHPLQRPRLIIDYV